MNKERDWKYTWLSFRHA